MKIKLKGKRWRDPQSHAEGCLMMMMMMMMMTIIMMINHSRSIAKSTKLMILMFDSCNKYTNVYTNLSCLTRDIIYLSMYERMNE